MNKHRPRSSLDRLNSGKELNLAKEDWRVRMGEYTGTPGELLYEYTLQFTQVVAYGGSADAVLSGRIPPPAEGARFDVYFEGPITGPK